MKEETKKKIKWMRLKTYFQVRKVKEGKNSERSGQDEEENRQMMREKVEKNIY